MPIQVQGPDGQTLEFPDGTPREVMRGAMQKRYGQAQSQKPRQQVTQETYDPTEGNSFLQNAMIGFGKSISDTGFGLKQAGTDAARYFVEQGLGRPAPGLRASLAEQQSAIDERLRLDAPLMATGGGLVGNVVGQAAQMAIPIPGAAAAKAASWAGKAAPYVGAAARSGAFGATQGVGSGESRGGNAAETAAWGAGGQALASGAGILAKNAKQALSGPVRESVALAKAAGIPLHLSQVTNSRALKTISSALNYLPLSGANKAGQRQQEGFNKAVGRSFGLKDAPVLSDDVMRKAGDDLGQDYESIFAGKQVKLDAQATRELFALHKSVGDDLEASQAAVVRKQIEKILDQAGQAGEMPGKVYQNMRSELRKKFGNGTTMGGQVMSARKILDDAARRSLGPADAKKLEKVNGSYANYKTTQDALKQVEGAKGNVKPASLWPLIRNGSTEEMRKLAQIGQNVLKDPIPDSGTPSRDLVYRALGLGGGSAGAASAVGMLGPLLKFGAAGMAGGRFLNSRLAEKMLGHGRPSSGLARLMQPAPKLLPAASSQFGITVGGGRVATPEEMERDAEIVRRFRQQQR